MSDDLRLDADPLRVSTDGDAGVDGVPGVSAAGASASGDKGPAEAAPGLFVTFEGGDGAGKTTQIERAATWLREAGREVVITREPGGTPLGAEIRRLLLHGDDVAPRAEVLLYAADRAHHVETLVRPALERGAIVLQDRYVDSSIAYQGAGRALAADDVEAISRWATGSLTPDVTVLIDVSPEVARERRGARGAEDRLEREADDFHARVREHFLRLAERDESRYLVLDAGLSRDDLADAIRARLLAALGQARTPNADAADGPRGHADATSDAAMEPVDGHTADDVTGANAVTRHE